MGFTEVRTLDAENTTALGGRNKKTGKANPTGAEGYYLGTREVESKKSRDGKAKIHFLQTSKGNLGIWGKTDLDRKLGNVTPGTMVRITQNGTVPTPNGDMYKFKVEVDASNTIDVSELTEASGSSGESTEENYEASEDNDADEDSNDTSYEAEEASQSAALSALERKAKVEALLKGKNSNKRN